MPSPSSADTFIRRLDRACGNLNAVLLAIALGLATLDFTFFVTLRICDTLARNQSSEQPSPRAPAPDSRLDRAASLH